MRKILLILTLLTPFIAKAQKETPDGLIEEWIYKDRQFRQKEMYCLKGEYAQELIITYLNKKNLLVKEKVKQVVKMYVIKPQFEDNLLPYEVGITEYWTLDNRKIEMDRVSFVYNEKY